MIETEQYRRCNLTFNETVQRQVCLRTWIYKNLKPIKRFNRTYGSSKILLDIVRSSVGDWLMLSVRNLNKQWQQVGLFTFLNLRIPF